MKRLAKELTTDITASAALQVYYSHLFSAFQYLDHVEDYIDVSEYRAELQPMIDHLANNLQNRGDTIIKKLKVLGGDK